MFSRVYSETQGGRRRAFGLSKWSFGTVCKHLQPGSSSLLDSREVVERVETIQDRKRRLIYGLEAGFGVRQGQSDSWVAIETQMSKKIRPIHVVSVTAAARASTSHFGCVLQGAVIVNRDDGPSNNPHFLFSEGRRVVCKRHEAEKEALELCVCGERGWQRLPTAHEAEETHAKFQHSRCASIHPKYRRRSFLDNSTPWCWLSWGPSGAHSISSGHIPLSSECSCLPMESTSNAFHKAVGQQVQSIVSITTSSSVTSGSEGKSLKAAGT